MTGWTQQAFFPGGIEPCMVKDESSPASELTWLTLLAILRRTSTSGTAQWQYIHPRKQKQHLGRRLRFAATGLVLPIICRRGPATAEAAASGHREWPAYRWP